MLHCVTYFNCSETDLYWLLRPQTYWHTRVPIQGCEMTNAPVVTAWMQFQTYNHSKKYEKLDTKEFSYANSTFLCTDSMAQISVLWRLWNYKVCPKIYEWCFYHRKQATKFRIGSVSQVQGFFKERKKFQVLQEPWKCNFRLQGFLKISRTCTHPKYEYI